MDHHGALLGAVGTLILQIEALRQLEVHLDGAHLPGPTDGVLGLHRNLGAVERGASLIEDQFEILLGGCFAERLGCLVPFVFATDGLFRVAGRQLEVEVFEPVVAQQVQHEGEQAVEFAGHLLVGAVNVGVVLGEATSASEPLNDSGLLVSVDGSEFEHPKRKLTVGTPARAEDEIVHRAVHGLEVVVGSLTPHLAFRIDNGVEVHRRIHGFGVPVEMAGLFEQLTLGDVRGVHELVAGFFVPGARVVLHDATHDATFGVEDSKAGADVLREREQVEFCTESAMVSPFGLFQKR